MAERGKGVRGMSIWKKWLQRGITTAAMIVLISMAASKAITGWSSVLGFRTFYVMSESMEPEIMTHQIVIGEYLQEQETPQIGQIYVYRQDGVFGGEMVIHRLIGITEDGLYQFKGDNNRYPDSIPVERESIGYRVIGY